MSKTTEMRKAIRKARKRGWTVVQSKRHYLLTWVNGGRVTASLSPSNQSGIRNFLADMRRVEKTLHKG
jgi:hypothetical protein